VLLDTLLRIENDHLFRYLQMTSYNNPTDEDVRLQDRHNRGLEIDDAKVKQITILHFPWSHLIKTML
jgi:UDP-N-acetylmuramoylalanine-D-glutamate ligase